jgi:hypothetical protein
VFAEEFEGTVFSEKAKQVAEIERQKEQMVF